MGISIGYKWAVSGSGLYKPTEDFDWFDLSCELFYRFTLPVVAVGDFFAIRPKKTVDEWKR